MKTENVAFRKHAECDSKISLWCLYIFHSVVPSRMNFSISYSTSMKNLPLRGSESADDAASVSCWIRDNVKPKCTKVKTLRHPEALRKWVAWPYVFTFME